MPITIARQQVPPKAGRELSLPPLDIILDDCLREVHARRLSIAECSAKHPEYASELVPLLKLASALERAGQAEPAPEFKRKTRESILRYADPPNFTERMRNALRSAGRWWIGPCH